MKSLLFTCFFFVASTLFALDPVEFQVGVFSFARPSGWGWVVPTSTMRKAQLEVVGEDGAKADVTFFHFGAGQGGEFKPMWAVGLVSFKMPKQRKMRSLLAECVLLSFRQRGHSLAACRVGLQLLWQTTHCAELFLEDKEKGDVFVKMTGPASLVESAWVAFEGMVNAAASSKQ